MQAKRSLRRGLGAVLPWAAILAVAAGLRFQGLDWDARQHLHPDERFLTMVVAAIAWPDSAAQYFDSAASPLNPYNRGFGTYVYGTAPLFLAKAVAGALGMGDYDRVYLAGRFLSGLFDLGTLLLVGLIARRLYGRGAGLLAAALWAVAVFPIQQAHFFTVDSAGTFWVTLGLWFALRVAARGRWYDALGLGAAFGLALACRINLLLFAALVPLAWAQWWYAGQPGRISNLKSEISDLKSTLLRAAWALLGCLLALAAAALVFRVAQPYAFAGPSAFNLRLSPHWLQDIANVARISDGTSDVPFTRQWAGRAAYAFPWINLTRWGLGWPLGLAAWVGLAVAGWRLLAGRDGRGLLPAAWIVILFAYHGQVFLMTMRYFLPLYPALVVLAAALLAALWTAAGHAPQAWARRTLRAVPLAVLALTAAWALAFTAIYRAPHPRIAASRWLIAAAPPGSAIANEHWDDGLPLRVDGQDPFGGRFRPVELPWYEDDSLAKLALVLDRLEQADFIVLSSNRLYDSIPRLPGRYPMTIRYYQALFSGALGFEQVAEFNSYPRLPGLQFPDQAAEEAFHVYDHPRVRVFHKTPAWSRDKAARLLMDGVDWAAIRPHPGRDAARLARDLNLSPAQAAAVRAGGTWARLFDRQGWANRHPLLAWFLALEGLALAAFPLVSRCFARLPDRGWLVARAVGLLLVAYPAWLLASLRMAPFSGRLLWGLGLVLALASGIVLLIYRQPFTQFLRLRWRLLVFEEGLFWLVFAFFLWIRMGNPDLWHPWMGGEKPMDFAYLNAVIKSDYFPAYNPWYAGGWINYYYFGHVLVAALIKATGVVPEVAYNLAVPTWAALAGAGAYSAAAALTAAFLAGWRRRRAAIAAGLAAIALVLVCGNLVEWRLLGPAGRNISRTDWYWAATRAIPHPADEAVPITEFPFFTFLYGDLHAHMLAFPYFLLVIALGAQAIARPRARLRVLALLALVTGLLYPLNAWDFPTGLAITAWALLLAEIRRAGRAPPAPRLRILVNWLVSVVAVVAAGRLLFAPFFAYFVAPYGGFEFWQGSRTPIPVYMLLHGLFLAPLALVLLFLLVARRRLPAAGATARWYFLGLVGLAAALSVVVEFIVLAGDISRMNTVFKFYLQVWQIWAVAAAAGLPFLAFPILGKIQAVFSKHWKNRGSPANHPGLRPPLLEKEGSPAGAGFQTLEKSTALFPNIGKPGAAMQTTPACGHPSLKRRGALRSRFPILGKIARAAVLVLEIGAPLAVLALWASGLLYPIKAIPARWQDRFRPEQGRGLDGQAFMRDATCQEEGEAFALLWDLAAIRWLQDNVTGTPVIVEAHLPEYRWGSRVSIHTGLPTIIGWNWHERQQRAGLPGGAVEARVDDVRRIYSEPDPAAIRPLLDRYGAEYVYLGPLERIRYPKEGTAKFETAQPGLWEIAYESPQVKILKVLR